MPAARDAQQAAATRLTTGMYILSPGWRCSPHTAPAGGMGLCHILVLNFKRNTPASFLVYVLYCCCCRDAVRLQGILFILWLLSFSTTSELENSSTSVSTMDGCSTVPALPVSIWVYPEQLPQLHLPARGAGTQRRVPRFKEHSEHPAAAAKDRGTIPAASSLQVIKRIYEKRNFPKGELKVLKPVIRAKIGNRI